MRIFLDFEFIENGPTEPLIPISVGMIREDGEEYYAEFQGVEWHKANEWVKDNVRPYLTGPLKRKHTIVREIIEFVGEKPEFWAYFADYDWVLLCQLYGTMMAKPADWPFYCLDIKQLMWHLGMHKNDLRVYTADLRPHHALSDAIWNRRAFNDISSQLRGGSLSFIRPGQDDRSRPMDGDRGTDSISSSQ